MENYHACAANFLRCHKHLGWFEPVSPSTEELHGYTKELRDWLRQIPSMRPKSKLKKWPLKQSPSKGKLRQGCKWPPLIDWNEITNFHTFSGVKWNGIGTGSEGGMGRPELPNSQRPLERAIAVNRSSPFLDLDEPVLRYSVPFRKKPASRNNWDCLWIIIWEVQNRVKWQEKFNVRNKWRKSSENDGKMSAKWETTNDSKMRD